MPVCFSPVRPWPASLFGALVLMAPFDLLASLAMDVYLPVVAGMPQALDTSAFLIQLTLSLYLLILGCGQLIFGPLSDRCGRRPILLGGASLYAVASVGMALADSGAGFLSWRIAQALGASAALVATFATVRDVYAERPESATIYGLFSAMLAFVPALGPLLGAVVDAWAGWRAIFWMLALLSFASGWRAWRRWPETRVSPATDSRIRVARIMCNRSFLVHTLGFATAMGAFFVFFSSAPGVLMRRGGYDGLSFSLAFASVAGVMLVVSRLAGRAVQRWGHAACFASGAALILAAGLSLCGAAWIGGPLFLCFVVPMWIAAAGLVLMVSVTANGALADFGAAAGLAVALYYGLQSLLVAVVGTMLLALFDDGSAGPLAAYCVLMPAASLAAFSRLKKV